MPVLARLYNFIAGNVIDSEQVDAEFDQILALLNGQLDTNNLAAGAVTADDLAAAILQAAGLNSTGVVRRGKSIVAGQDSRTNTAYGVMPTPDRVTGLVVPTDALVLVSYQAQWRESVAGQARAALFIGSNQQRAQTFTPVTGPQPMAAQRQVGGPNTWAPLSTASFGLVSATGDGDWLSDVTTGQALGMATTTSSELTGGMGTGIAGLCVIESLVAGTYDVSVQFKASSGTVDVRARRLRAWVLGF